MIFIAQNLLISDILILNQRPIFSVENIDKLHPYGLGDAEKE